MSRVYNFSAGPAVLPVEVLKEAADEMLRMKRRDNILGRTAADGAYQ